MSTFSFQIARLRNEVHSIKSSKSVTFNRLSFMWGRSFIRFLSPAPTCLPKIPVPHHKFPFDDFLEFMHTIGSEDNPARSCKEIYEQEKYV